MTTTKPSPVQILDCTLRDGSYAINFHFTASDTYTIVGHLDQAGVPWIEVGHGVGLRASEKGFGVAAETDEAYMRAAARAVKKAKFGVFCIPGVAELDDVDRAVACGIGFIRIGTNMDEVDTSAPFIERARKHGLFVCSNLMKSYAGTPEDFGRAARRCADFGSQMVYIVDSAGGMLVPDLDRYILAYKSACALPFAFHGHNNLGLAVSNSLHAIELGASIVDSSLQGLGRSSGNAPTEQLAAALLRMGHPIGVDFLALLDVGEQLIRPLIQRGGQRSLDTVCGYSQFHSSYMGLIRKVASMRNVDPRSLIMEVCKVEKTHVTLELVERCSALVDRKNQALTTSFRFDEYFGDEEYKLDRK
jgi:4-hydroxy-2-oxovalerate aldolase